MENSNKRYWKGIEELTNEPSFVKNIHNEFGNMPSENDAKGEALVDGSGTHRRDFLKMLGFGVAAVSLAACEAPVKNTIPYLNKPEDVEPTIANWYASTYTDGGDYASILVKTREGRPIKIEGNKLSSVSKGTLSGRAHASVLSLYDNEKLKGPQIGGKAADWTQLDKEFTAKLAAVAAITNTGDLYTWGQNDGNMIGRTSDNTLTGAVGTTYDPGFPINDAAHGMGYQSGRDKALSVEVGGHTTVYVKEGSTTFCYVGHRTNGSMGESTASSATVVAFDCSNTPTISLCGAVPIAADPTKSTISANPTSIQANGTTTSTITIQLKDSSNNNLTTTGGTVAVTTTAGTLGTVVDNNNGTYTVTLTSAVTAGTATLGFSINGTTATGSNSTATVTFTAVVNSGTPVVIGSVSSLTSFTSCTGTPSVEQDFTISGTDLTGDVVVTAPTGFEVSLTSGSGFGSSVTIPASGTLTTTTIYIRLATSATAGPLSGTITLVSQGATTQNVAVSGVINLVPPAITIQNSLCTSQGLYWSTWNNVNGTTATGNIGSGVTVTVTHSAGGLSTTNGMYNHATFPSQYNVPNGTSLRNDLAGTFTFTFNQPVTNPQVAFSSIGNSSNPVGLTTSVPYHVIWNGSAMTYTDSTHMTGAEGFTIVSFPGTHTSITIQYDRNETYANIAFGAENFNCSSPSVCQGDAITLTASGGSAYQWSPSTGLSATNTAAVVANPTTTTTYSVIDSSNACAVATSVTITVNTPPVISGSASVGNGNTITLTATTTPSNSNAWVSSNPSVATVSSSGVVNGLTLGTTTITYTNSNGCSTTKVITVVVSDTDGDGVLDNQEVLDATSPTNSCDFVVAHRTLAPSTVWNNADCDSDGIPNGIEGIVDTDNDGTPDFRDLDSDNDGITDAIEKGPNGATPIDTDNDGTPDYRDLDSDNDGITDAIEKGNGTTPRDTDNDGTPDYRDLDSDNDGITDAIEKGNGTTPRDTDNDGTPDYRDLDSDNDGITDAIEKGNGTTPLDTDNDGTPDYRDLDSDNDGITDALEKGSGITPLDTDNDGIPDFRDLDTDNDGIADNLDNCPITVNANQADNDHDGQGDVCDADDDNDGILDTNDNCPITANANQADRDHDGKGDVCDLVELNVAQAITPNGDGVNDTWVIYNIENHPGSIVRVFNRWGNEVYYSNNYHNDWDGHYKNLKEGLPSSGAYMYQIDLNGDGTIDAQGWLYITN